MDGDEGFRWTISKYLAVRAGQCLFSHATQKLPSWQPAFRFGDAAVFGLSCGQLMYGFFVRQQSLDADYIKFMEKLVGVDSRWIELNRQWLRNGVDGQSDPLNLLASFEKINMKDPTAQLSQYLSCTDLKALPCQALHPDYSCLHRVYDVWMNAFREVVPMYFSLHLVPSMLFRLKHFIQK